MTFQEIFNERGLYKAKGFAQGVCFSIDRHGILEMRTYQSPTDLLPTKEYPIITKDTFDRDYQTVFTIKQLFNQNDNR